MSMVTIEIWCPSCGEVNEIQLEQASWGAMVQDCWVCCRPIEIDLFPPPKLTGSYHGEAPRC